MDGVILSQTDGEETWYFQYDGDGVPIGFIYNGAQYLYMTDQMGSVIGITEADGFGIAEYSYDDWGNMSIDFLESDHNENAEYIANANPIRYRGYYYDHETGYYYLQSRYYDPSIYRFINADLPKYALMQKDEYIGTNLFAYCCNDPVNNVDPTGYTYSPSNAKKYAERWWDDFNPNYKKNKYDCANFVSQCLYAGGLSKMTGVFGGKSGWHHYHVLNEFQISYAWGRVNDLFCWLYDKKFVKTTYVLATKSDVEKTAKKLKNKKYCTAIIIFDCDKTDGDLDHATISGKISYTNSKKDIAYYGHTSKKDGKTSSVKAFLQNKQGIKLVYVLVIS